MASRERDCFNEINITPLTDIFLVLLIIMMVIAPLLDEQGLNLTVPQNVEAENIKNESKILTIAISADGTYTSGEQQVSENDLEQFIKDSIKNYPDGLMLETDGEASHGSVVRVMDIARNSGVTNISVTQFN